MFFEEKRRFGDIPSGRRRTGEGKKSGKRIEISFAPMSRGARASVSCFTAYFHSGRDSIIFRSRDSRLRRNRMTLCNSFRARAKRIPICRTYVLINACRGDRLRSLDRVSPTRCPADVETDRLTHSATRSSNVPVLHFSRVPRRDVRTACVRDRDLSVRAENVLPEPFRNR